MGPNGMQQELAQLGNGAHALATRILGSSDDAADAVHDAFTAALRRPEAYDPARGSLKVWFLGIVRYRCIDMLRQRRPGDGDVDALDSNVPGPDAQAELAEGETLLHRALGQLAREQQEIIILRDFLDLSYAEISQTLKIPAGTVMSRLHRARLALKKEFSGHE
jgi:RNA polymerase sigma-70 factor (ECF subfamily)